MTSIQLGIVNELCFQLVYNSTGFDYMCRRILRSLHSRFYYLDYMNQYFIIFSSVYESFMKYAQYFHQQIVRIRMYMICNYLCVKLGKL